MHLLKNLLLILFIVKTTIFCQTVTISEILDANLFRLSDGRVVKLAGVDAPQKNVEFEFLKEIAQETIEFSNSYLRNQKFKLDVIEQCKDFQLVIISKEYPFETIMFNYRFLEKGFGKYISNNKNYDTKELVRAQNFAIENNIGIWKYYKKNTLDTLDYFLSKSGSISIVDSSIFLCNTKETLIKTKSSIPLQFLTGAGLSLVSSIVGGIAGYGIEISLANDGAFLRGLGGAIIGTYAGYFVGFTSGVYLNVRKSYPNIDYTEFLVMTFGMSILSITTAALLVNDKSNGIPYVVGLLSPIIFSLTIANTFYNQPVVKIENEVDRIKSFHDFRESQTTRIELFRINF